MKYRVFDGESRQFTNVPIQPRSNFRWPEEDEIFEFQDERDHHEPQYSDEHDEQPAEPQAAAEKEPEQEPEETEVIEGQSPPQGICYRYSLLDSG